MKLKILLEPGEDGWIVVHAASLPGCVTQGKTRQEAIENIKDAIGLWLEVQAEREALAVPNAEVVEIEL